MPPDALEKDRFKGLEMRKLNDRDRFNSQVRLENSQTAEMNLIGLKEFKVDTTVSLRRNMC